MAVGVIVFSKRNRHEIEVVLMVRCMTQILCIVEFAELYSVDMGDDNTEKWKILP